MLEAPGSYTVRLRYWPRAFLLGLALSLVSLVALGAGAVSYRRGYFDAAARAGGPLARTLARTLLWCLRT